MLPFSRYVMSRIFLLSSFIYSVILSAEVVCAADDALLLPVVILSGGA